MDFVRVLAIDAGYRNFAYCVLDNVAWHAPTRWENVDLWAPYMNIRIKPNEQDLIRITRAWCVANRQMIEECDHIILENQIRSRFQVQNCVIQTLFYDKVQVVSPMTVGAFFRLPVQREHKKSATVKMISRLANIDGRKKDDLADVYMMALYSQMMNGGIHKNDLEFLKHKKD